ncbi:MAG: T9SS type A sorting domain-containing protein, partial [Lentimicrobiaceae bacterium]|nr:T9SS type A sorting domain-containing protein [Lentimicrobiaceae bacterium]
FVLYPNPAKEIVTVMRSSTGKARIEVFTAQGSLLKMYEINDAHSEINISSLPAGIYIIKLIDNKNVAMQKLVKFE